MIVGVSVIVGVMVGVAVGCTTLSTAPALQSVDLRELFAWSVAKSLQIVSLPIPIAALPEMGA